MQTLALQSVPDFTTDSARHQAIRVRDARAEGRFFYAVLTTGVYCRPTCAARPALRENVSFHASADDAERAGFRPCKRCRPRDLPQEQRHANLVASVRQRLEDSDQPLALASLASQAGVSPYHLHRLFKKHVGMTPREYAAAWRLQRAGDGLRDGASVTSAIYAAGYSSSSRFYEAANALGMTAAVLRRGGEGVEMHTTVRACSLGQVLVAASTRGVCAISFGDAPERLLEELQQRFPRAVLQASDENVDALADQVVALIEGSALANDLPLDLIGTAFQQRVWRALRDIPRGSTASYSELAQRIGAAKAVRAVGTACGQNPVAVAIPCHRALRQDGSLGGYRWGLERKRALLEREGVRDAR